MAVNNQTVIRTFLKHSLCYKWQMFFIFLSIVVAVVTDTISPWYLKKFFDVLSSGQTRAAIFSSAISFLLVLVVLRLIGWLGWRFSGFLNSSFEPRVMADLQRTCFDYLLGHSYHFFTNSFSGSLVRKVGRLSRAFERIADEVEFRILPLIVILIGSLIGLYLRFPLVAGIFLAWVIFFIYLNYLSSIWKLKVDVKRAAVDSESTGLLADALTNSVNIKLFAATPYESNLYKEVMGRWRQLQTKGWNRGEIIFALQGLLMIAIELGLFLYGLLLWQKGTLTIGDLILIQTYLSTVLGRLWDIGRCFRNIFEGFADAKEMIEVLELPYDVQDERGAPQLKVTQGEIEFKKVNFYFNPRHKVLSNFNLKIKPGEKIALVGPSGAGKSTVVKLLFRFYDVASGQILIDGQNIAKVTQDSLRQNIGLVPQEPILFHRSLLENIRYGRRAASDAEVKIAAQKAHCHEFIIKSTEGYQTYVGERGIKLSGGERQRVAIARAILKNAPILLLDEATSSLDSESESLIQESLRELIKDKTTIVIAHRLSTIMQMDRIVVVEGGRVVAMGTHQELLQQNGIYQKLWQIQAGGFIK